MVGGISYKLSSDKVLDYGYNYTDTGNVENVYENGKKVAVYTYDELNQLVWYADTRTGCYIRIVYDNYGNIQKMESYSLGTNWAPVKLLEQELIHMATLTGKINSPSLTATVLHMIKTATH